MQTIRDRCRTHCRHSVGIAGIAVSGRWVSPLGSSWGCWGNRCLVFSSGCVCSWCHWNGSLRGLFGDEGSPPGFWHVQQQLDVGWRVLVCATSQLSVTLEQINTYSTTGQGTSSHCRQRLLAIFPGLLAISSTLSSSQEDWVELM